MKEKKCEVTRLLWFGTRFWFFFSRLFFGFGPRHCQRGGAPEPAEMLAIRVWMDWKRRVSVVTCCWKEGEGEWSARERLWRYVRLLSVVSISLLGFSLFSILLLYSSLTSLKVNSIFFVISIINTYRNISYVRVYATNPNFSFSNNNQYLSILLCHNFKIQLKK